MWLYALKSFRFYALGVEFYILSGQSCFRFANTAMWVLQVLLAAFPRVGTHSQNFGRYFLHATMCPAGRCMPAFLPFSHPQSRGHVTVAERSMRRKELPMGSRAS